MAFRVEFPFLSSHGSTVNTEVNHLSELDRSFLSEESFNEILALERKRTARSKRPFILMLINIAELPYGDNGGHYGLCKKLVSCLKSSIRDTDALGWYLYDKVIGILYTEIGDSSPKIAADIIVSRVRVALSSCLNARKANSIRITLFFYPEESGNPSQKSGPERILYPDIEHRNSMKKVSLIFKRAMDIAGSIFILLLLLPVMIVISALVRLTSDGPVLFKQERIGRFGKKFYFLKFRSMYANNDSSIHQQYVSKLINSSDEHSDCNGKNQVFKITDDPRITPVGRFLRRTSLDEFPQFLNVLKGHMSLVGPRPPIPYELDCYDIWHRRRILEMKPGITGLWQVHGRSRTSFNDMVRLDIRYIDEWSLWLDIKLLFQTPWVVVTGKGAY